MSSKKIYLSLIDCYWWLEHRKNESLATYGYRKRKLWEHKYMAKFHENIYGDKL